MSVARAYSLSSSSDEEGSFVSSASSEAAERAGRLPALRRFIGELPAARGAAASASRARRGSDEPTPPPRALVRAGVLDSTGRRLLFGPVAASAIRALERADKKRAAGSAPSAPSVSALIDRACDLS
jgi:hypothetical protein